MIAVEVEARQRLHRAAYAQCALSAATARPFSERVEQTQNLITPPERSPTVFALGSEDDRVLEGLQTTVDVLLRGIL